MRLKEKLYHLLFVSMTLKTKVILGMSIILIILMGVFTYVDVMHQQEFFLEQTEKITQGICDTVMKSIEYPMLDGEMQEVQAILERLKTLESLHFVYLCDCDGTIRCSGESSDIGRITASEITRRALETGNFLKGLEIRRVVVPEGEKILRYAVPIPNEQACFKCHGSDKKLLGALAIGYKWEPIENAVKVHRNRHTLFFVIAVIVILFFLSTWLTGAVTRPISVLTRWANEISRGNLDASFELRKKFHCWEEEACTKEACPAYGRENVRCWYVDGTLCQGAPFYVLGPLVTDIAAGYDHIACAIGGALAGKAGADFLCYVTPSEHLKLPSPEDVREGVIAARIAAHAADIARGHKGAIEQDRKMAEARSRLDWDAQIRLAIDPVKAKAYRRSSMPVVDGVCTMCGEFCAIKMVRDYFHSPGLDIAPDSCNT